MMEAQLGKKAKVSHKANSAYGIPLDILGMAGIEGSRLRWFTILVGAPLRAFKPNHSQKIYLAEVDAERPGEAKFLAKLLKPELTMWVSSARTHSMYFDKQVAQGKFRTVEDAIAHEFGEIGVRTSDLLLYNGDNKRIVEQAKRASGRARPITREKHLKKYDLTKDRTTIQLKNDSTYSLAQALPPVTFRQVAMVDETLRYLKVNPDYTFSEFVPPPGRSSIFSGIKKLTLVDSTYNANLSSMKAILSMFKDFPGEEKWLVVGDMLEQGKNEAQEHKSLAIYLAKIPATHVVLLGPRVSKYTQPEVEQLMPKATIVSFDNPKDVLDYINTNTNGGETILFKGARFLEGVVENLLADKSQKKLLARQSPLWEKRRKGWGL